jgi:mono/diheme cytochrome c family protein
LEDGVVTRGQDLDTSPLVSGLSEEGKKQKPPKERPGGPPAEAAVPPIGAPDSPANYVDAFPFAMSEKDLQRGMIYYTAYCTPCHGVLGNGGGKIVERGYLRPTSYHTEPQQAYEPAESFEVNGKPAYGYSRGFRRWGINLSLREAPVGYFFEVITKGYGGMPTHAAQIEPDDRWRIIAYVRALQLSRHADLAQLPEGIQAEVRSQANAGDTKTKAGDQR